MISWLLFRKYMLGRRSGAVVRTVSRLSLLSVSVGVSALIIVMSVMNGFNESIHKKLLAVEPHLVVSVPGARTAEQVEKTSVYQRLKLKAELISNLYESQDVIVRTADGLFSGGVAKGLDWQRLSQMVEEARRLNTLPHANRDDSIQNLEPNEIILGSDLAKSLGILEGDYVTLISPESLLLPPGEIPQFDKVLVRKLLSTNISDVDGKMIYYVRGKGLRHLNESTTLSAGVELVTPNAYRLDPYIELAKSEGASAATWVERNSSLFHALKLEKLAIGMFLSLSALIASFSIITVIAMLLAQKRRELGLMIAMGLSLAKTRRLFFQIGLYLSGIGISLGLTLGIFISVGIDRFKMPILPEIYYDQTIPAKFEFSFLIGVALGALVIAIAGSWLPTWHATRELNAAQAIRMQRQSFAKPH